MKACANTLTNLISRYQTSWLVQVVVLTYRSLLNNFRHPNLVRIRMLRKIFMGIHRGLSSNYISEPIHPGIFVGLLYLHSTVDQEGIANINGALYFSVLECSMPSMFGVINVVITNFSKT